MGPESSSASVLCMLAQADLLSRKVKYACAELNIVLSRLLQVPGLANGKLAVSVQYFTWVKIGCAVPVLVLELKWFKDPN